MLKYFRYCLCICNVKSITVKYTQLQYWIITFISFNNKSTQAKFVYQKVRKILISNSKFIPMKKVDSNKLSFYDRTFSVVSCRCCRKLLTFLAHLSWKFQWAFLIVCRPYVCLSICLSVNFSNCSSFLQNYVPILTKLGTKHPLVKGIQVCSNEGP